MCDRNYCDRRYLVMELDELLGSKKEIYCVGCQLMVSARLTNGEEMYPHREDLECLPFWVCDTCRSFVGTHHQTDDWLRPLGFLATPEIKRWRMIIHGILDPLWKTGKRKRGALYAEISEALGRTYHTAEIYSVDEARKIYEIVKGIKDRLDPGPWNR